MGVHGLTKYLENNSKSYLKPYKLCDSYLVIDGSNIASYLYKRESKSDSAFGGDYDEYFKIVKKFFSVLKKCNVTPIVLFDGGYKLQKIQTMHQRVGGKLPILRSYARGFSTSKFYPLFMKQTFFDVMEDMGIFCIQCDLEADVEVAAVAQALKCPVLSYDSDYFIYDVLYIPLTSLVSKAVKFEDSDNYYIRCSIYEVKNFSELSGLDKSLLPVLAALMGNDYIDGSIFHKLFGRVHKSKKKSFSQGKIHAIVNWFKEENVETAIERLLKNMGKKGEIRALNSIMTSVKDYTNVFVSESVMWKLKKEIGDIYCKVKNCSLKLPFEILQLYCSCQIHKSIIDMVNLGVYVTTLQVENVFFQSSHFPSLQIIRDMYVLLTPYMSIRPKPLKIYLAIKNRYRGIILEDDPHNFLDKIYLHELLKESKRERMRWLCALIGIDENDLNIVSTNNWSLFLLAVIYWIKKLSSDISSVHIHALILMAIANQIGQKCVGYYRNLKIFMKNKENLLEKLKSTPIEIKECNNFAEMLESVTYYEKLLIQRNLIPYRLTTESGKGQAYCISTMHLFGCFQSCLFHIMQMNALLNHPLPHLRISDFYSGTLLFNLYLKMKTKPRTIKFGHTLLKDTPNLHKIYVYLYESLAKFSKDISLSVKKPKKRKKKKKNKISDNSVEEVIYYKEDDDDDDDDDDNVDDEYNDENNLYAILQNEVLN